MAVSVSPASTTGRWNSEPARGPHALGVRRIDGARRQGHAEGPGRIGHSDQGARVARVGHLMGEHDLAGAVDRGDVSERGRFPATGRNDSLGGLCRDQPGEPRRIDHMQRHTRGVGGRNHLVATIDPVLVDEQLDGHPRGQGLPDSLRALSKEQAPRPPELRHRELTGVANARRSGAQHGFVSEHAAQHVRSPPDVHAPPCAIHVHGGPDVRGPRRSQGRTGPTGRLARLRRPESRPAARRARSRPARRTPPRRSRPARPACGDRPRHQRPSGPG